MDAEEAEMRSGCSWLDDREPGAGEEWKECRRAGVLTGRGGTLKDSDDERKLVPVGLVSSTEVECE